MKRKWSKKQKTAFFQRQIEISREKGERFVYDPVLVTNTSRLERKAICYQLGISMKQYRKLQKLQRKGVSEEEIKIQIRRWGGVAQ